MKFFAFGDGLSTGTGARSALKLIGDENSSIAGVAHFWPVQRTAAIASPLAEGDGG